MKHALWLIIVRLFIVQLPIVLVLVLALLSCRKPEELSLPIDALMGQFLGDYRIILGLPLVTSNNQPIRLPSGLIEENAYFTFDAQDDQSGTLIVEIDDLQLIDFNNRIAPESSMVLRMAITHVSKNRRSDVLYDVNTNKSTVEIGGELYRILRFNMRKSKPEDIFFSNINITFEVIGSAGIEEIMEDLNVPIRVTNTSGDDTNRVPIDLIVSFFNIEKETP